MKTIFTILISLLIYIPDLFSQSYSPEWSARFNAGESSFDLPTNMAVDSSGNVYVTGKSWGDGSDYDYSTVKYNSAGVFQWEARYNGPGNYTDIPNSIAVDKSGNVYVTGKSYSVGTNYDFATIKYNSNGIQQWVDRYNGLENLSDEAYSLAVDNSGNVYVNGTSIEGDADCTTIKYNANGIRIWVNNLWFKYGKSIKLDTDENLYVGGMTPGGNSFVIKYNSFGNEQWISTRNGELVSIEVDKNKNVYLLKESGVDKINFNGTFSWSIVRSSNETINSLRVDGSCNVYVVRTIQLSDISFKDIRTSKYDSNGVLQWNSTYNGGGNLYDAATSLTVDYSGNVYSTGYSFHIEYPSNKDFVTIKYNSSGIKQWVSKYAGPYGFEDVPVAINTDGSGNIYVTGYSYGYGTDFDYLTIKYPGSLQLNATLLIEGFYNDNVNRLNTKDTLTAYLRNTTFPYSIADSGKAVIDSLNFLCGFCFNRANSGTYYVSIKHRNSIEIWSKAGGEVFSISSPSYYNFTTSIAQAYGNNMKQKGSKYCMISGNVNQDFIIDAGDISAVENDVSAGTSGYVSTDLNGDEFVDAADLSIVENNIGVDVVTP